MEYSSQTLSIDLCSDGDLELLKQYSDPRPPKLPRKRYRPRNIKCEYFPLNPAPEILDFGLAKLAPLRVLRRRSAKHRLRTQLG